jgi:hypothetical protein
VSSSWCCGYGCGVSLAEVVQVTCSFCVMPVLYRLAGRTTCAKQDMQYRWLEVDHLLARAFRSSHFTSACNASQLHVASSMNRPMLWQLATRPVPTRHQPGSWCPA